MEAAGKIGIKNITEHANRIYNSGSIPEKMKESEFIVTLKKEGVVEYSRHRIISIMSQMSKII